MVTVHMFQFLSTSQSCESHVIRRNLIKILGTYSCSCFKFLIQPLFTLPLSLSAVYSSIPRIEVFKPKILRFFSNFKLPSFSTSILLFTFYLLLPQNSPDKDYKNVSSPNDFQNLKYINLQKFSISVSTKIWYLSSMYEPNQKKIMRSNITAKLINNIHASIPSLDPSMQIIQYKFLHSPSTAHGKDKNNRKKG